MRNSKIYPSLLLLSVVFAAVVSSAPARAANVSVHFNGTLGKPVEGTCSSGYADKCFSGFCGTVEPTGTPKVTGTFGKGTVTAMCVTLDGGNNVNEPNDSNGSDTCVPLFGDMTVQVSVTKKKVTTVTTTVINFAGVSCHHQANSPVNLIEGGWGIDGADSTDTAATGWGTLTGSTNKDTGVTSLTFKGSFKP